MKQRGLFSPVSVPESQPVASNVTAPSSESRDNTAITAEEMHSVIEKPDNLTASTSAGVSETEKTAHLSGKPEFIENSVETAVTDDVNTSMSELSLALDTETVPPADDSVVEGDDAKVQPQTTVKSEITTITDEDADASIASNDVSVNDSGTHGSPPCPAAASELQQQVAASCQDTETGNGDSPVQTSRDVVDLSTYQTDEQEARSDDVTDTVSRKNAASSGSTSETFTSCIQSSPSGSESVFCSPHSDISVSSRNNNNSHSSSAQQHSARDRAAAASETKTVIYSRSDSLTTDERRDTVSECTQSVLTAEKKADKGSLEHLDESSKKAESKEPLEGSHNKDRDSEVDDITDDNDDDDEIQQSQSAAVAQSVDKSAEKSEEDIMESLMIRRPPRMQSETVNTDKETDSGAAQIAKNAENKTSNNDVDTHANSNIDAANRQRSPEDLTYAKVCKHFIFDVICSKAIASVLGASNKPCE